MSPALDYSLTVKDKLTIGAINRTTKESFAPGGKGINVSIILKRLGYTSIALGFLSGFTGEYVEKLLAKEGLQTDFIHIAGITRINVKMEKLRLQSMALGLTLLMMIWRNYLKRLSRVKVVIS